MKSAVDCFSCSLLAAVCLLFYSCADPSAESLQAEGKPQQEVPVAKADEGGPTRDAVQSPGDREAGEITVIRLEHLFALKQSGQVLLVDCRQPLFHRMGSIPGSVNLPVKKFDSTFSEMKPSLDEARQADQIIVLYCQNEKCPYAYQVAKKLSAKGYKVTIYNGGWDEWKHAGLED
ncbi:rhodanese-like domain-containing protein [Verrucomicrobiaceae bacterium N1E253]|uniref:Rhodanese-like domain-containing protein n=1 Tax=Oceaniferula marina TaxID=2748318 RepID=A0A851GEA7_9BACT|nr:rhodanese-like domain-containing protein [Oceaniferula marina]NWK54041.1 rhodanese-like domain-containing protein [Oceaniferula marina]